MKLNHVPLIALVMLAASAFASEPTVYHTYLPKEIYKSYMDMLDGRDPLEIDDISGVSTWRMTAEPLIFQVAPVLGGCNCRVEFAPYDVAETPHARSIEQVRRGIEISHGIAGFADDSRYADAIALSTPILRGEDFYVGLYTHEDRNDVLSTSTNEEIKNLRFGVGTHWEIDNRLLAENHLPTVQADNWLSLVQLIKQGRADVMLQPFVTSDDLGFVDVTTKLKFIPIPGVKMQFGHGRHFFVSKLHPDGEEFLNALNRGLDILESDGILYKTMQLAGVINKSTADFRIIEVQ